ncbi:tRNA (adenosine(37)-N6)-threonylcarbamoyltransferase complex transferase subunit TsaD [Candidatus Peregrinibacteria bacterium]|nr:tRNA (adenosine(37)-N6)-threonylcarbamoyltransferase complex transferase subunit TsaD [Candidatus Peregrinibacteria bacterium]
MLILGIETSCDETAASVILDGRKVLSNVIASQIDLHALTGGVVPEVAAREHAVKIIPVIHQSLKEANVGLDDIDAIAVTQGPGLIGCLLVGVTTAKTIALAKQKPLIPVNHIVGHLYSSWLSHDETIQFPVVSLTVSGGHNELVLIRDHYDFEVLGETLDDAAGEAYDKAARLLGLGYPGGPAISKRALKGNPHAYHFPRAWLETKKNPKNWINFHFSFSGLKTAFKNGSSIFLNAENDSKISLNKNQVRRKHKKDLTADLAASFQHAVNEVLSTKLLNAAQQYKAREIHLVGGVSANQDLRYKIEHALRNGKSDILGPLAFSRHVTFRTPRDLSYCTDNAAMIAAAGYFKYQKNPSNFHQWRNIAATTNFEHLF